jgi:hypothetical protein
MASNIGWLVVLAWCVVEALLVALLGVKREESL